MDIGLGSAGLDQGTHVGVVAEVDIAILLLRLIFFSFVLGVIGVFSPPLPPFLMGMGSLGISTWGKDGVGDCVCTMVFGCDDCTAASRDFERMKDPGSPTRGLSSMYSPL